MSLGGKSSARCRRQLLQGGPGHTSSAHDLPAHVENKNLISQAPRGPQISGTSPSGQGTGSRDQLLKAGSVEADAGRANGGDATSPGLAQG